MDLVSADAVVAAGAVPSDPVDRSITHPDADAATHTPSWVRRHLPPWALPVAVGVTAVAGCLAVRALNPVVESNPPACPFKIMTGLDCPGCGATRATNALLHGNLGAAPDHNLLFVVLLPVILFAYAVWALRSFGVAVPQLPRLRRWAPALVVLTLAFWGLRLLPWQPFTWLASDLA